MQMPEADDEEPILYFWAYDKQHRGEVVVGNAGEDADTVRARFLREFGHLPWEVQGVTSIDTHRGVIWGYTVWEAMVETRIRRNVLAQVLGVTVDRFLDYGDGDFRLLQDYRGCDEEPCCYSVLTSYEALVRVSRCIKREGSSPGPECDDERIAYAGRMVERHGVAHFLSEGGWEAHSGPYTIVRWW